MSVWLEVLIAITCVVVIGRLAPGLIWDLCKVLLGLAALAAVPLAVLVGFTTLGADGMLRRVVMPVMMVLGVPMLFFLFGCFALGAGSSERPTRRRGEGPTAGLIWIVFATACLGGVILDLCLGRAGAVPGFAVGLVVGLLHVWWIVRHGRVTPWHRLMVRFPAFHEWWKRVEAMP